MTQRLHIGAAYYPEHWPEERWPEDIRLMREAGFTVARLAEFAWSTIEPEPGRFQLDWLDRAVAMLAGSGMVSVLGTPTAAPPAWLTRRHPDTLAVDEYGRRAQHGNRCHGCPTSPQLHAAARAVVTAMARRFGQSPHVIGWQTDNEFNRVCFCDRCRTQFQRYLAQRYSSLAELNRRWSTAYWSQTYSAWDQVPLPIGPHNPALMLEHRRFVTACYRAYQRIQLDALRPHLRPGVWVTHNFMGWFEGLDHYEMSADLDLASWDWYVPTGQHDYLASGATHDLTRGFRRRGFWLMETQPGGVNWAPINTMLERGEGRAMAWHAVGHGAEALLYWQWRSAYGGQEQLHGSLVDQSGQPRPFYAEAQQVGRDFAAAGELAGATAPADVAILNDYDSRWAIGWQRHHRDFDYVAHLTGYYRPLAARNVPVDIISADAPLDGYRLVIAPALLILTPSRAEALRAFVARGGHLVLTIRTGMKDDASALLPQRQPGPLAELAGAEVEEYYALVEPVPVEGELSGQARIWAERLRTLAPETQVISRFGAANGWLDGQPAITARDVSGGRVYLVGAWLDDAAQQALVERVATEAGVTPVLATPPGVEARRLQRPDGQELLLLINHTREPRSATLPSPAHNLLVGADVAGDLALEPYGVALLAPIA